MLKVLHVFKTYYPDTAGGGIEQVILQLSENAKKYGVQAEVLFLSQRGRSRNEAYLQHIVHRSKLNFYVASTGFSLEVISDLRALAKKVDVIHYHFPWPFMDLLHFVCGIKKPTLVTYHSDIVRQKFLSKLYAPLMHSFLKSVNVLVASSPNYLESSPVLKLYKEKVKVIPFGLDESTYPRVNSERMSYWKDRLPAKFFLFVGVLRYYKGLDYLIDAATQVEAPIVIVGHGPEEAALKAKIQSLDLQDRVLMLGRLDDQDKMVLLTLCYSFVFPSHLRSEAFGISLLEAAMLGKPLISCEIGTGTSFINMNGNNGITVPPNNSQALADAMSQLWADENMAKRMGENSLERFDQVFQSSQMLESYSKIYYQLVSNRANNT